jgi:hypothetical protein
MPIKQSQEGAPRLAEKRRRKVRSDRGCTHIGYDCNQFGYDRQAETPRRFLRKAEVAADWSFDFRAPKGSPISAQANEALSKIDSAVKN